MPARLLVADEAAADLRAIIVDAAPVAVEKLAAVFDDQLVGAVQGKMEAGCAQLFESQVLVPTEVDIRKGSSAKGSALAAAGRIVQGVVQQQTVSFVFVTPGK